jgi:hypothetical protein
MEDMQVKCLRSKEIQLTSSRKKLQGSQAPAVTEYRQWELQLSHHIFINTWSFAKYQTEYQRLGFLEVFQIIPRTLCMLSKNSINEPQSSKSFLMYFYRNSLIII